MYDLIEALPERRFRPWLEKLWSLVRGSRVLEVGVGTGKNMPFWPREVDMTAIDLTPGMLERAHRRAAELNLFPNDWDRIRALVSTPPRP